MTGLADFQRLGSSTLSWRQDERRYQLLKLRRSMESMRLQEKTTMSVSSDRSSISSSSSHSTSSSSSKSDETWMTVSRSEFQNFQHQLSHFEHQIRRQEERAQAQAQEKEHTKAEASEHLPRESWTDRTLTRLKLKKGTQGLEPKTETTVTVNDTRMLNKYRHQMQQREHQLVEAMTLLTQALDARDQVLAQIQDVEAELERQLNSTLLQTPELSLRKAIV